MYKKSKIIMTSALISLALSNSSISIVRAIDNDKLENNNQHVVNDNKDVKNISPQVTPTIELLNGSENANSDSSINDETTQSNTKKVELLKGKIKSILSGKHLDDFVIMIKSEVIGVVLLEALMNHEELEFSLAEERYIEVVNYLNDNNMKDNVSLVNFLYSKSSEKLDIDTTLKQLEATNGTTPIEDKEKSVSPKLAQLKVNSTQLSANDYYLKFQNARQASDAWEIAQKFKLDYPNDNRLQEVMTNAANRNLILGKDAHQRNDFNLAIVYYDRLLNESLVHENLRNEVVVYHRQASSNEVIKTADIYYQESRDARQASDAWGIAQNFKRDYPNDNRILETINNAGMRSLILGQDAHQKSDFGLALVYYNRLLNESLINDEISTVVTVYQQQASNKKMLKTANDYYRLIIDARQASDAWEYAQQFKHDYPNDKRITEAINRAGERNFILGKNAHLNSDFELAINYYERLINESVINNPVREEAIRYHKQAVNEEVLRTADDYYQDFLAASQASVAWEIGQRFKQDYPEDIRVHEVINSAAQRNMTLGIGAHKSSDFEMAKFYYRRIVNESLVVKNISNLVTGYYNQATTNRDLMTPEKYFDKSLNAYQASDSWNWAQMFKGDFPNHALLSSALSETADRNFKLGVRSHQSGSYELATIYYNRIINESLIDSGLRALATTFNQKANNKMALNTAEYYRNSSIRARGASDAWNIAQEGLKVHPNSSIIIEALNDAASRNVYLGRENQRNGNNDMARSYFTKVIGDERVEFSIRNMAKIFRQQLNSSHSPIVFIDPGHGGHDSGASFYGVRERDLNLNVSSILRNELEARGYTVVLSRNTNMFLELADRAKEANRLGADIFISVHHNSMGGSGAARGIETFIYHRVSSGFGQEANRNNFKLDDIRIKESLLLADYIHGDLIRTTGMSNRGVKGNNFSVLRNTDIPAVLLELGFMDNRTESSIIRQISYQTRASKAIADGIDKYFKGI